MAKSVERRGALSVEEFVQEYAEPRRPVILTEAAAGWPALDWTADHLAACAPEAEIRATPSIAVDQRDDVYMTLKEYAEYLKNPDERLLYMTSWNFKEVCPQLLEDFEVPQYFRDDWLAEIEDEEVRPDLLWIFVGPARSGLFLHVDIGFTSAWNVQLSGSKEWKLYPPEQADLMYDGRVNVFAPDLASFPDFARAEGLDCTVGPGECLYVPPLWWHQTRNLDDGIALTANYADRTNFEDVLRWFRANTEKPGVRQMYKEFRRVVQQKRRAG